MSWAALPAPSQPAAQPGRFKRPDTITGGVLWARCSLEARSKERARVWAQHSSTQPGERAVGHKYVDMISCKYCYQSGCSGSHVKIKSSSFPQPAIASDLPCASACMPCPTPHASVITSMFVVTFCTARPPSSFEKYKSALFVAWPQAGVAGSAPRCIAPCSQRSTRGGK